MATVVLLGTLDTKGREYDYLRDRLREQGVDVLLVDAGVFEPQAEADVTQEDVAAAGGAELVALREANDRGAAVEAMCRGSAAVAARLHAEGKLDGLLTIGGSGNSSIRGLPSPKPPGTGASATGKPPSVPLPMLATAISQATCSTKVLRPLCSPPRCWAMWLHWWQLRRAARSECPASAGPVRAVSPPPPAWWRRSSVLQGAPLG